MEMPTPVSQDSAKPPQAEYFHTLLLLKNPAVEDTKPNRRVKSGNYRHSVPAVLCTKTTTEQNASDTGASMAASRGGSISHYDE